VTLTSKLRPAEAGLPLLRLALLVLAAWGAFQYFSVAWDRVSYEGELEWMEGGVLHHVRRVSQGLPIYVEPSAEFTPYIYTPFYYWLCAGLGSFFGVSLQLLRVVSALSFVLTLVVIAIWGQRRGKSWIAGVVGAAVFACTFRLGGAWFDIARGDSLFTALLFCGAFLLLEGQKRNSAIVAGALCAFSVLTKQSALLPVVALIGWATIARTRRHFWFAGTTAGLIAFAALTLHITTSGWFTYYILELPAAHPLLDDWKILYWQRDVFGGLLLASVLLAFEVGASLRFQSEAWKHLGFPVFAVGVVLQSWSSRFHLGMYDNVLMPLHALLGLGVACSLGRLKGGPAFSRPFEVAVSLGLAGMIWNLEYPLEAQRPTAAHHSAHKKLVARLKKLPKDTWVPFHSSAPVLAGHEPRAHWMALIDVHRGGGVVAANLQKHVAKWLSEKPVPAIVWSRNDSSTEWFHKEMRKHYRASGRINGPRPLTGWGQHPVSIWLPRKPEKKARP